jgi:hypothetical protein
VPTLLLDFVKKVTAYYTENPVNANKKRTFFVWFLSPSDFAEASEMVSGHSGTDSGR